MHRAGTMVLPFLALWLTKERGLPVGVAGAVLGTYGLGSIAGSFLGGQLSDRIGARRTMIVSLLSSGAGYMLLARLETAATIVPAVFVVGALAESFRPAVMAIFARLSPDGARTRAFALLRLAANLGMAVGPAVGGFLALRGYHWIFVVDGLTCWLAAIVPWKLIPAARRRVDDRAAPDPNAISPWADGPFLALMLIVVGVASIFFQISSTLPLYLREVRGFREDAIGLVFGVNALTIALFEMVLMLWLDRFARLRVVAFGAATICIGFGLLPFGASLGWVLFTVLVWTTGEMICLPYLNTLVAERASSTHEGRYMGLYVAAFASAFVFAPVVGTQVYQRYGPDTLWYCVAAMAVPLAAGSLMLHGAFARSPGSGRKLEGDR